MAGTPLNRDYLISQRLATAAVLEFTTDEVDEIAETGEIVEVTDLEGTLYRGFLKEVDLKYAMPESAKYKLIVKEIER